MRNKFDQYMTPPALVQKLQALVNIYGSVFEPCCGDGAISQQFLNHRVLTNDIDSAMPAKLHRDASYPRLWQDTFPHVYHYPDWVVTNPPFNRAHEILRFAWAYSTQGVAMLLRLSFFEPVKNRCEILNTLRPFFNDLIIFSQPRPSFSKDGRTDSSTVAWFVWRKAAPRGLTTHYVTNWQTDE